MLGITDTEVKIEDTVILNIIHIGGALFMNQYGEIYTMDYITELLSLYNLNGASAYIYGDRLYHNKKALFMDKDSYIITNNNTIEVYNYYVDCIKTIPNMDKAIILYGEVIGIDRDYLLIDTLHNDTTFAPGARYFQVLRERHNISKTLYEILTPVQNDQYQYEVVYIKDR